MTYWIEEYWAAPKVAWLQKLFERRHYWRFLPFDRESARDRVLNRTLYDELVQVPEPARDNLDGFVVKHVGRRAIDEERRLYGKYRAPKDMQGDRCVEAVYGLYALRRRPLAEIVRTTGLDEATVRGWIGWLDRTGRLPRAVTYVDNVDPSGSGEAIWDTCQNALDASDPVLERLLTEEDERERRAAVAVLGALEHTDMRILRLREIDRLDAETAAALMGMSVEELERRHEAALARVLAVRGARS